VEKNAVFPLNLLINLLICLFECCHIILLEVETPITSTILNELPSCCALLYVRSDFKESIGVGLSLVLRFQILILRYDT